MPAGLEAGLCRFHLVCSEHTVGCCKPFVQPSLKTLLMGNHLEPLPFTKNTFCLYRVVIFHSTLISLKIIIQAGRVDYHINGLLFFEIMSLRPTS